MAWITDDELKAAVAGIIGMAAATDLPANWNEIVPKANRFAFNWVRAKLAGRGYSPAQMDLWDMGPDYNRSAGLCRAFKDAALKGEPVNLSIIQPYCDELKELDTVTITAGGEVLDPASESGANVGYGDFDTGSDTFTPDTVL